MTLSKSMQAEVGTLLPSSLLTKPGEASSTDGKRLKADLEAVTAGLHHDIQAQAGMANAASLVAASREWHPEELLVEHPRVDEFRSAAPSASALAQLSEQTVVLDERRRARHAYGEELLRQAEDDAQRRRAAPLSDKPQWINPSLGAREDHSGRRSNAVPVATERLSLFVGPPTMEVKKLDARTRRAYGEQLMQQVESNRQLRQAELLTDAHEPGPSASSVDHEPEQSAAVAMSEQEVESSPRRGVFNMGAPTMQLRKAEALSRRAYGEELRQQAEEDRRRRQANDLSAKPQWLDPRTGGSRSVPGRDVSIKRVMGDATMQLRHADVLQRRAYGEELRQQAEADHQRRRQHTFTNKIPWSSPTYAGVEGQDAVNGIRDVAIEHRRVHHDIHVSAEGRPHAGDELREMPVEHRQDRKKMAPASTAEVEHAQRLAYGEELRQQAELDRKRRHEKPLPDKPQWCDPSGRVKLRPFAAAAAAMGVAYR